MRQYTTPTSSVLYFLHSDHPSASLRAGSGSVSVTTCGANCGTAGAVLSRQKFDALGNLRTDGSTLGTMPTDVAFTGQRENLEIGLHYFKARYYVPGLGRFLSADTVVPGLANPQSLNRYSYGLNNPVRYSDPTGHYVCDEDTGDCSTRRWNRFGASADLTAGQLRAIYGIQLTSDVGHSWTAADIRNISEAVQQTAAALDYATWANGRPTNGNVARFFKSILYTNLTFHRSAVESGGAAFTDNGTISVYVNPRTHADWGFSPQNAVHELGHAFSQSANRQPYNDLDASVITDNQGNVIAGGGGPGSYVRTDAGYVTPKFPGGSPFPWQQHRQSNTNPLDPPSPNEDFADMFLGWAYGNFANDVNGSGAARGIWMSANMPRWIPLAVNGN